jgi:NAD(P)H-dependent flavin oxidoreductase YrpB (nitropropane dioxygenase family)
VFNSLCDRFGITVPFFAFSHDRAVVAAVTEAGGFGVLGAASMTPETFEAALTWLDERVPNRYGVDLIFPAKSAGDDQDALRAQIPPEHVAFAASLGVEFDVPERVDPEEQTTIGGMATEIDHLMTKDNARALWAVVRDHRVKLLVSALGPLPEDIHAEARAKDMLLGGIVGAPRHARRQAQFGVDLIIAQGSEAGGHTGTVSTLVVVPKIVEAAGDVPVIAAGGVASGSQIAACLALGAQGVWMGSVWLASTESAAHPIVKERIVAAEADDTAVTLAVTGKPTRQLRTEWTESWLRPGAPTPLPSPVQQMLARDPIVSAFQHDRAAFMGSAAGQAVSYISTQEPVKAIIERLAAETSDALDRLRELPTL